MAQPHELTLAEAASAFRDRTLSPIELVKALVARIEAHEPRVQAWETLDPEGALRAARDSEAHLSQNQTRPLEGLPLGVKDIFYTAGLRTTAGFPPFHDHVPSYDAAPVERLRAAGAVILGKTVTTQFALVDPPKTRNPWNTDRTPGGSSSGSAAAVAARMIPAALGSQTAGSVLRPASYCGVIGFKPSFGRISRFGVFPLAWSLDHVGMMARTVEDVSLLYRNLVGHDPRDPGSLPDTADAPHRGGPPHLALATDFMDRAEPEVRDHVTSIASRLITAGATVVEVKLPEDFDLIWAVQQTIMRGEIGELHRSLHARHADDYSSNIRAMVEVGQLVSAADYVHAQRLRHRIQRKVTEQVSGFDAYLTPSVSNTTPDASTTGDPRFQAIWTLIGLPSITLPTGLSAGGLPFGTQLTGGPLEDLRLLGLAGWCEEVLGAVGQPQL